MPADPRFDRLLAFFRYGGRLSLSWLDSAPAADFLPAVRVEAAACHVFTDDWFTSEGFVPAPGREAKVPFTPRRLLAACHFLAMEAADAAQLGPLGEPGGEGWRGDGAADFAGVAGPSPGDTSAEGLPHAEAETADGPRDSRGRVLAVLDFLAGGGVLEVAAGASDGGRRGPTVRVRAWEKDIDWKKEPAAVLDPREWEAGDPPEDFMRAVVTAIRGEEADGAD